MSKKLTVPQQKGKSLVMRNGIEILVDEERANKLQDFLVSIKEHKFVQIDGRTINTADLVGIFELADNLKK